MNLDDLRTSLSDIDRQLVELIARRQNIVSEIGKHKRSSGTATRDYGREKDVLEMARAFSEASGRSIPIKILPRRPGDVATCYADASRAAIEFGWRAEKGLDEMCRSAWHWQSQNPDGYGSG